MLAECQYVQDNVLQLFDGPLQEQTSDSFHYIPFSSGSHLHEIHFVFVMNISDIFSIEAKQQSIKSNVLKSVTFLRVQYCGKNIIYFVLKIIK